MGDVALWLIPAVALAGWWYLSSTREHALAAAKRYCQSMGVQFLDDSIMGNGLRFTRIQGGQMALVRCFRFEFSTTGEQRYSGFTEVVGKRVVKMELEPHRVE